MLLAGDEFGRTQKGNNNAYCQDSPVSWLDWNLNEEHKRQLDFVRRLIDLRRKQPVFRRRHFFQGRAIHGTDIKDLYWIRPDGMEMSELDWSSPHVRCLGMGLLGDQIVECDERGQPVRGDSFLILMNAGDSAVPTGRTPEAGRMDTCARHIRRGDRGATDRIPSYGGISASRKINGRPATALCAVRMKT